MICPVVKFLLQPQQILLSINFKPELVERVSFVLSALKITVVKLFVCKHPLTSSDETNVILIRLLIVVIHVPIVEIHVERVGAAARIRRRIVCSL